MQQSTTKPDDQVPSPVDAFLALRPYYSREHVEEIAAHTLANNIPFCAECTDWHHSDEEHTTVG